MAREWSLTGFMRRRRSAAWWAGLRAGIIIASLLLHRAAHSQTITTGSTGVQIKDEGAVQGGAKILNCVGSGITCTATGGTATITANGGAGSGAGVEVSVNLGSTGGAVFTATVSSQSWVTASSYIACAPFATAADGQTVETYAAAGFTTNAAARVVGASFDLWIFSPRGATGTFRFHCLGL